MAESSNGNVVDDIEMPDAELVANAEKEAVPFSKAELDEIEAYQREVMSWRTTQDRGTDNTFLTGGTQASSKNKPRVTFHEVSKRLLPKCSHQNSDEAADALVRLEEAELDELGMEDTEPLTCLTNLKVLSLRHNKIQSLDGLEFMLFLRVLHLRDNVIVSLEPISQLPLEVLDVALNKLENLPKVLLDLPVGTLRELHLLGNPCTPCTQEEESLQKYRATVFDVCPALEYLDSMNNDKNEPMGQVNENKEVSNQLETNFKEEDFMMEGCTEDNAAKNNMYQIDDGMSSHVLKITSDLIQRYEDEAVARDTKMEKVANEIQKPKEDNNYPTFDNNEANIEEISEKKKDLQKEIQFAYEHQTKVGQASLDMMWMNGKEEMRLEAERRREERRRNLDQPSAAYARALKLLQAEAGTTDLSKYREIKTDSSKQGKENV